MKYRVLYDQKKDTVVIGSSVYHECLVRDLSRMMPTQQMTLEQVCDQNEQWLQDHQFFFATSNLMWKKHVVETLESRHLDWITVINENSAIDESCHLGKGVLVNNFNVLLDGTKVGDHVVITNQCLLSHQVNIGNMCHISPRCHFNWCDIGAYTCLASNCTMLGQDQQSRVTVPAGCNFKLDSRVTRSLDQSGTYVGMRLVDSRGSLEYKFF